MQEYPPRPQAEQPQAYYPPQQPPYQQPYYPPVQNHPNPQPQGQYGPPPQYYQQGQVQYPQAPYYGSPQQFQQFQPVMQNSVNVNVNVNQRTGPGLLVRALYFVFVGSWLGFIWLNIGFSLCATIILLPFGLTMLNNLPKIMTLKSSTTSTNVNVSTTMNNGVMTQNINVNISAVQQYSFLIRALYYCCVGWWAGLMWAYLAYACCASFFLLPVGVMMFDRLPALLTLRKN